VSHLMAPVNLSGSLSTQSSIVTVPEFPSVNRVSSDKPFA